MFAWIKYKRYENKTWIQKEGEFLGWGLDTEEAYGSFTVAIVRMIDKTVELVQPQNIIAFFKNDETIT